MTRIRRPLEANARAMVPPPAPLPMMTTSYRSSDMDRSVDLVHQMLVVHGPLQAHLRNSAGLNRPREIAIHGAIAADVAEAWHDQARNAASADDDEQAIRLEGDDALPAEEFGCAKAP